MKRHQGLFILAALGLAILMAGCWGSSKDTSLEVSGGGASPIATATAVGIDRCNNCHANTAVGGVGIFEAWAASRHGNNDGTHADLPPVGFSGEPPAECNGCHDPNGDSLNLALYTGAGSAPAPRNVVGCEACHGGGSLHFGVGPIGGPKLGVYAVAATAGQSSLYNTCIGCHVEKDSIHAGNVDEIIYDTHFENTAKTDEGPIQGYIIRKAKDTACTDCHDPHSARLTENRQWKASGHGDFDSAAWWEEGMRNNSTAFAYDRCQRCHSATGYVKYTTDQDSSLGPEDFAADGVNDNNSAQLLYCWSCHQVDPARGFSAARRVPEDARIPGAWDNGQIVYSGTARLNSYTTIPGKGDSEICMNCHSSRPGRNGFFVRPYLDNQAGGVDNTFYGGPTPHYLVGDQTIFQDNTKGIGAYALPGKNYANDPDFMHSSVGGSTAGPCVGCHMSSPNSATDETIGKHSFLPVTKFADGTITAITSSRCAECHDGTTADVITVVSLNALKTQYKARLAEFRAALEDNTARPGIYPNANGNRFYNSAAAAATNSSSSPDRINNWQTRANGINAVTGGNLTGYDLFGICFNFNYLNYSVSEPGAYVHNSKYANRLIYDAIEALGAQPSFARP